ncbi:MAG TPA: hypothetical protein VHF25_09215 [Nitriliruptorales bacterium]|nr:hypothetical protein [Nitriliruptorales bacterium]
MSSTPRAATLVRPSIAFLAAAVLTTALIVTTPPPADAAPTWAPVTSATIRPGVMTFTEGAQCTANFVFTDGTNVYLGQAAHCAGTGGGANGCDSGSLPLGTSVTLSGASQAGALVYSSWLTMQQVGETDPNACHHNDFALVKLHPADHGKVNPTVPFWGGPKGLDTDGTLVGEPMYSYGNSSLRLGLSLLSPQRGYSLGDSAGGWNHQVYSVPPGVFGDSGSGVLDGGGRAVGTLQTVQLAPLVGSNGVSDLHLELDYMRDHTGLDAVDLVNGTQPFQAGRLL